MITCTIVTLKNKIGHYMYIQIVTIQYVQKEYMTKK